MPGGPMTRTQTKGERKRTTTTKQNTCVTVKTIYRDSYGEVQRERLGQVRRIQIWYSREWGYLGKFTENNLLCLPFSLTIFSLFFPKVSEAMFISSNCRDPIIENISRIKRCDNLGLSLHFIPNLQSAVCILYWPKKRLPSATKFATRKQHKFCAANIKSYHQRKIFWEVFATFNFSIGLLAAKVNRKIERWHRFQRPPGIKLPCVLLTTGCVCGKMTARHGIVILLVSFFFLSSVIKVDKKCANSTQRSQSSNSWGWSLFPQSQGKELDEVIYHQVIPASQILADFCSHE